MVSAGRIVRNGEGDWIAAVPYFLTSLLQTLPFNYIDFPCHLVLLVSGVISGSLSRPNLMGGREWLYCGAAEESQFCCQVLVGRNLSIVVGLC